MISGALNVKDSAISRFNRLVPLLTKIMGVMLIFYSTLVYYVYYKAGNGSVDWNIILGITIMIICGILILIDLNYHLNRAIGLYAIAIAVNRIFRFIPYLGNRTGVTFVFSLIMIAISVNLILTGVYFLGSTARGRVSMELTTLLMLILNVGSILYLLKFGLITGEPFTFWDLLEYYPDSIALVVMYILLICMLNSKPIRMISREEKNNRALNMIRLTEACGSTSHITKEDAEMLAKAQTDRSDWKVYNDIGPVECETRFNIYHDLGDCSYVTVQKWKGSDRIYFTICDHDRGSVLNAYRFGADTILITNDGTILSLFNNDGMSMRISIGDPGAVQ